jgi:opacity protein-like surface antigen
MMQARTTGRVGRALAFAGLLFLAPALARAEIDFGVRGGLYSDADAGFLGVELLTGLPVRSWFFNPNFEYVFVDDGSLYTLNLDAHYDLRTGAPFTVWLGGGPAVIFSEIDPPFGCRRCESDSETNLGLNLLGGVGFWPRQAIRPYVQGKVTLSDNTEASIAFGLRFH